MQVKSFLSRHMPKALVGLGLAFVVSLPSVASAQRYDGYCYQKKSNATATGAILGAVVGGVIGNEASNRWDRGGNTVAGAAVGAAVGGMAGNASVSCHEDRYYSYDAGYYDPPPPPRGYVTVYYNQRPNYGYRSVYRDRYYGHYAPPRAVHHHHHYGHGRRDHYDHHRGHNRHYDRRDHRRYDRHDHRRNDRHHDRRRYDRR